MKCEVCGSLVRFGREQCPYCEAPLPQPGFFRKYMWELGGGAAGAVLGTGGVPAVAYIAAIMAERLWYSGPPWHDLSRFLVVAPAIGVVLGAGLGVLWGYRMRRGRARLYEDWDNEDNLTLRGW